MRDVRAGRLHDETDALVDHGLELDRGFLRAALVVELHDLEPAAEHAAAGIDDVDLDLELTGPHQRDIREGPRELFDQCDTDGVGGAARERTEGQDRGERGDDE